MDATSILLVVGLIVGSGLIAFFGDWFGTKLGKARISIFGLRPRRTANVITIFTGIIIAGLTLGLLVLVSEGVRARLFKIDEMIRKERELRSSNSRLKTELDSKTVQVIDVEHRYRELVSMRNSLQKRIGELQSDVQAARSQREQALREVNTLRKAEVALKARLADARREVEAKTAQVATMEQDLKTKGAALDQADRELAQVKEDTVQQKKILDRQLELLRSTTASLDEADRKLAEAEAKLTEAETKLTSTQEEQKKLEAELARVYPLLGGSMTFLAQAREGVPTYRRGEEVARGVIEETKSPEAASSSIRNLLRKASTSAEERKAKGAEDGSAVEVIGGKIVDPKTGTETPFAPEDKIRAIAEEIAGNGKPVVVLVVAAYNAVQGEPVKVDFELYGDRLTLDKGELLAEAAIDGTKPKAEVFTDLMSFVSGAAREKAQSAGIIPQNGKYVEVSYEELIEAMDRICSSRRSQKVSAVCAKDTWASDVVNVDLVVR